MNIGIFGGTFNPIHNCHLHIAKEVWRRMKLDRVVFVPAGHPPHKPEEQIQSPKDRLAMVRLAIADFPYFDLSDQEVNRSGKSYSIETLEAFKQQFSDAEIFFILGIDAFLEIDSWRNAERLIEMCHFVVVSREGFSFRQLEKLKRPAQTDLATLLALDQGRIKKKKILLKPGKTLFLIKLPPCPISSTHVREQLRARQDMKNLLPDTVKSYILKNRLYQV
ncbi:MAG: nicotinate-nucleotide adenylyltransferase [Nitrospira sp.]|nr:nicotinate-nucleotide adenylyltransferase [Nitrospira sp.]